MSVSTMTSRATLSLRTLHHSVTVPRHFASCSRQLDAQSHLPRVANPALWRGMIPKAFRKEVSESGDVASVTRDPATPGEKNPGLPLIVLGLLAGSFAINIIALRREMTNFTRKTETKLALLREVIQKVKNGEDVDVKRLLGTGDPESEREWEEVMKELENTDMLAASREKKAAKAAIQEKPQARGFFSRDSQRSQPTQETVSTPDTSKGQSGPKFMM